MKIMLPPRREHDFHKITVFTFPSNFEPKWDPKSKDFDQKRARGEPKISTMAEKVVFWSIKIGAEILDGKKRNKMIAEPSRMPQLVSQGVRPGTMYGVSGRVREGRTLPYELCTWSQRRRPQGRRILKASPHAADPCVHSHSSGTLPQKYRKIFPKSCPGGFPERPEPLLDLSGTRLNEKM